MVTTQHHRMFLRVFSKVTCFATLFLIFAGGLVTSTGSGLSVPDWPLSYGMLFPPMVGGVFYEHGHRMIATLVGFFMLVLSVALWMGEDRRWVKNLGVTALGAVILQGVLGGITVLMFLPPPVSVAHGMLAQTFFLLTIVLAYSQSQERINRAAAGKGDPTHPALAQGVLLFIVLLYLQLFLGAAMRHAKSGLAIPDFPTMGGQWVPMFDKAMLQHINVWRFEHDLDPVALPQVILHFLHRLGGLILALFALRLNITGWRATKNDARAQGTLILLDAILAAQVLLGILTVMTGKAPLITTLHVTTGAGLLGVSVLLLLRCSPLKWANFRTTVLTMRP